MVESHTALTERACRARNGTLVPSESNLCAGVSKISNLSGRTAGHDPSNLVWIGLHHCGLGRWLDWREHDPPSYPRCGNVKPLPPPTFLLPYAPHPPPPPPRAVFSCISPR